MGRGLRTGEVRRQSPSGTALIPLEAQGSGGLRIRKGKKRLVGDE